MSENPATPNPSTDAAEQQQATDGPTVRQHLRGNKVTLEIPEEIHAVATLTGKQPGEILLDIIQAGVANIRAKAKSLTLEKVL